MSRRVFLGVTSANQGLMCLAQGDNTVTPVRLEPATPLSRVKHSTTEQLPSLNYGVFLALKAVLTLANGADTDEMQHCACCISSGSSLFA